MDDASYKLQANLCVEKRTMKLISLTLVAASDIATQLDPLLPPHFPHLQPHSANIDGAPPLLNKAP